MTDAPLHVFIVAGEHSGDQLGFKLMRALKAATGDRVRFSGLGGEAMAEQGLVPLFPLADIAVMGFVPVIKRLPTVLARIRTTAEAAKASASAKATANTANNICTASPKLCGKPNSA